MKKFTSIIFLMLIACCFIFTGCGATPLTKPTGEYVSSNGGFMVGVGNYMYFANAFNKYSNLTTKSDNNGKNVAQFSMKRAQVAELNEHDYVMELAKNEEGVVEKENVINKIAGYETSNMYVVGKYMYFTTPNVHKNKENKYEFNLSTLFRINLDGTGLKEVFTTDAENATFYLTGGEKQTILIFDDNKIKLVEAYNGSTEAKTISEEDVEVENVVFPKVLEKEIVNLYYTVAKEEGLSGNCLKRLNLQTLENKEVVGYVKNGETLNIIAYENNRLFYTRTGGDYDALYSNNFSNGLSSEKLNRYVIDGIDSKNFAYVVNEENETNCFVFSLNDKLYVQDLSDNNGTSAVEITSSKATVKLIVGSYIIYTTDSGIYKYSVKNRETAKQVSDVKDFNAEYVDYDGQYVYFFAKAEGATTETYYLHRADTMSSEIRTECVAELLEEDIAKETEETEE